MKWMAYALAAVFGLGFMMFALACTEAEEGPPPVVGDWESAEDWCGFTDEMEVEDDLKGEAKIALYCDEGTAWYCEYDLEVEKDGSVWVFDLECGGNSEYDFEMECEIDGDTMECEGTDGYLDGYDDFEWEKQ